MNYSELINKNINVEFNGKIMQVYQITHIEPTAEFMSGRGQMFECSIDWKTKIIGGVHPEKMMFDGQTLRDLSEREVADCPSMPSLKYRIVK